MLAPNNSNLRRSNSSPAGWAITGAVVMLMSGLVYFSNGRSSHAMPHGNAQLPAVQSQPHR